MSASPRIAIIAKPSAVALRLASQLDLELRRHRIDVLWDSETSRRLGRGDGFPRGRIPPGRRLVLSLGGDGTLLAAARAAPDGARILGINLGTLGFLTGASKNETADLAEAIRADRFERDRRRFLEVRVRRRGRWQRFHVLNDAVFSRTALSRIARFELRFDGRSFAAMRADGLIVASATGSTAYNLSAGGPLLHPGVDAYLVTPICPHALAHRSIVMASRTEIEIRAEPGSPEGIFLTLDGQEGFPLAAGEAVRVHGSRRSVTLLRMSGRDYFATLSGKLNWGA